jgi:hemerythrin-like domain-containing protein
MEEVHRSGPGRILVELEAQHAELRKMMDRCEQCIQALEEGQIDLADIARETARLRLAFAAHNTFEEQALRPLLLANDAFGVVRCDRMIEDHVSEHRELRERLLTATESPSQFRDVIETLRAHLDAEERYLLSAKVLRDVRVAADDRAT